MRGRGRENTEKGTFTLAGLEIKEPALPSSCSTICAKVSQPWFSTPPFASALGPPRCDLRRHPVLVSGCV